MVTVKKKPKYLDVDITLETSLSQKTETATKARALLQASPPQGRQNTVQGKRFFKVRTDHH